MNIFTKLVSSSHSCPSHSLPLATFSYIFFLYFFLSHSNIRAFYSGHVQSDAVFVPAYACIFLLTPPTKIYFSFMLILHILKNWAIALILGTSHFYCTYRRWPLYPNVFYIYLIGKPNQIPNSSTFADARISLSSVCLGYQFLTRILFGIFSHFYVLSLIITFSLTPSCFFLCH